MIFSFQAEDGIRDGHVTRVQTCALPISAWQRFLDLGENRKISLTTKPEPYTFDKTLRWLARQVAPTWKLATKLDEVNETTVMKDMLQQAKLTKRHQKLLMQQAMTTEDVIQIFKEED